MEVQINEFDENVYEKGQHIEIKGYVKIRSERYIKYVIFQICKSYLHYLYYMLIIYTIFINMVNFFNRQHIVSGCRKNVGYRIFR